MKSKTAMTLLQIVEWLRRTGGIVIGDQSETANAVSEMNWRHYDKRLQHFAHAIGICERCLTTYQAFVLTHKERLFAWIARVLSI